ncbi:hypothetical protein ACWCPM_33040 [Streptomyces sp. NPDC002309]
MTSIRRALTVAAAAASAAILSTSPASAYPNWQPWVPTAMTTCGETTPSKTSNKVINQTCMIVNPNDEENAQGVLLVRNNASVNITIDSARVYWLDAYGMNPFGEASCVKKVLVPGELTACYGMSAWPAPAGSVQSSYMYNGIKTITKSVYFLP